MSYFNDLTRRLRCSWIWVMLQFVLTLVLIAAGYGWTRIGEKNWWQVTLTLFIPLLLTLSLLELEAGTMRSLSDDNGKRVKLVGGAAALLVWVALLFALWTLLDWCDDRIPLWAGYLNSRASAGGRATLFTFDHLQLWFTDIEWLLRWVVIPAKLIPHAIASAQWGWRLPLRRIIRLLFNWRWWLGVIAAAFVGVSLPGHFFKGLPGGTVSHQVWTLAFKVTGTYLLAVACWVVLLAWAAVLMSRQPEPKEGTLDQALLRMLRKGRGGIGIMAGWAIVGVLVGFALSRAQGLQTWDVSTSFWSIVEVLFLFVGFMVPQTIAIRAMMKGDGNPSRLAWGVLSGAIWVLLAVIGFTVVNLVGSQLLQWVLDWFVLAVLLVPFSVASAQWGFRVPLRRILRMLGDWRWWLGTIPLAVFTEGLPDLLAAVFRSEATPVSVLEEGVARGVSVLLRLAGWVMLLAWAAVLMAQNKPLRDERDDEAGVLEPVGSGPLRHDAVKLPLPESGDDVGGNA